MFDIAYSLLFDLINALKWIIPIFILFGIIGRLMRVGK